MIAPCPARMRFFWIRSFMPCAHIAASSGRRTFASFRRLSPRNVNGIIAARGEDGAVLSLGGKRIIFAADGIIEEMIDKNPIWAGYCSILVNVNDILAMGGRPIAAVNVISAKDDEILTGLVSGIGEACDKFDVRMVGGHLHPKAGHNEISVSMLGEVVTEKPLLSTTAEAGDLVVEICDCVGEFTPDISYSWDSTSRRSREEIGTLMGKITDALSHFSSGKDVSNPGLLGTIAMLLEASGVGAEINIDDIPMPAGVDLLQWLKAYQGFGFIGTAPESRVKSIAAELEGTELNMAVIGMITSSRQLKIRLGDSERVLFDLAKEKITGLF